MQPLQFLCIAAHRIAVHVKRLQPHGTPAHALAAAQAHGILRSAVFVMGQAQDSIGRLDNGNRQVRLGKAHHRAAADHTLCGIGEATGCFDQVMERCADTNDKVLGHMYRLTGYRDNTLGQRHTPIDRAEDGRKGGYSRNTIKKTQDVLSSIMRTATDWDIIDKNPMDKIRTMGDSPGDKIEFFTPDQAAAFLNYIEKPYKTKTKGHKRIDDTGIEYFVGEYESEREMPEQMKILFNLAIYGGLRKGELLALEWSDIDFENNTVNISKSTGLFPENRLSKSQKQKTLNESYRCPDGWFNELE